MLRSLLLPLVAAAVVAAPAAAQTLRFQTSVGSFDMLLNPTNNADLDPLVDNMLANVAAGVYHRSVVNRAVDNFVLQIGSFQTESVNVSQIPEFGFAGSNSFDPVVVDADNDGQVDFDTTNLNNTRGTVSLALSNSPNSGSASFFVNLTDNSFLDAQGFVPFAEVSDLSTIDRIMNQTIVDLSAAVGQNGSLAYTDVPLTDNGDLIVIENVAVVSQSNQAFVGPLQDRFGQGVIDQVVTSPDTPSADPADPTDNTPDLDPDLLNAQLAILGMLAPGLTPTPAQLDALASGELTAEELVASLDLGRAGAAAGASASAANAAVPEPAAALLVGVAMLGATLRRRWSA